MLEMSVLLESTILWSYDHELRLKTAVSHIGAMFSGVPPVHNHEGSLFLTNRGIHITGDQDLLIPLGDIEELYLGFDENYPVNFIKNFGAFCKPMRIKASTGFSSYAIYLILDYKYFGFCGNQALYNMLREMLS